jgi:hypothetical protein
MVNYMDRDPNHVSHVHCGTKETSAILPDMNMLFSAPKARSSGKPIKSEVRGLWKIRAGIDFRRKNTGSRTG